MIVRQQLLTISRKLVELDLNRGTAGNVSVRLPNGFLVTPSGMSVEMMTPLDLVQMDFDGTAHGKTVPSSEWRFHRDIYQRRPEVGAVIHTHAMFATTLACMRKDIPPFHYMIALVGGDTIRCAPYALFGTQALSDGVLQALVDRKACLMANHGMIAVGRDMDEALAITLEVETLCEQYWRALQIGEPVLLTHEEMAAALEQFKGYGRWKTA